jgi:3-methyladenine DNA glycosylase AlkD
MRLRERAATPAVECAPEEAAMAGRKRAGAQPAQLDGSPQAPTADEVRKALRALGSPEKAAQLARFFKTGPGEYGEGDRFLGVRVPQQRALVRRFPGLPLAEAVALLRGGLHEERLTALLFLVRTFQKARDDEGREAVVRAYLANLRWVDNWDLVDSSAPYLLGPWLLRRDRALLWKLARSKVLWQRRVAVLSTFRFIVEGESRGTLALAAALLGDGEDLMHKAVGWMLREVGKRVSLADLRGFLGQHAARMPRTMLRYAIERLPEAERKRWMAQGAA